MISQLVLEFLSIQPLILVYTLETCESTCCKAFEFKRITSKTAPLELGLSFGSLQGCYIFSNSGHVL
jgi:hypothetical protein